MDKLYSVRIIRRVDQAVSAVYIKEFFKFCGVYVDEFVLGYDKFEEDNDYVDFNIILEDGDYLGKLKARDTINIIDDTSEKLDLSSRDKREAYGQKISKYLMKIPEKLSWNNEWKKDYEKVYHAFVESDFAYNNYLTHMFLEEFDEDMKLAQIDLLDDCLSNIYAAEEVVNGSLYRQFAYFNCARKYNRIFESTKINYGSPFEYSKIMKAAYQLSVDDYKYSMGNVLAGVIGLASSSKNIDGEVYMYRALKMEEDNRYSTFIYYTLAHYYERKAKFGKNKAWDLYRNMVKISPKDYQGVLALARKDLIEKRTEDSLKKLIECLALQWLKLIAGGQHLKN